MGHVEGEERLDRHARAEEGGEGGERRNLREVLRLEKQDVADGLGGQERQAPVGGRWCQLGWKGGKRLIWWAVWEHVLELLGVHGGDE